MGAAERLRADLDAAIAASASGLSAADRVCHACVDVLAVDGAAISLVHAGESQGTFGSSGELSRRLDEFQFTFGEGPCLDAVVHGRSVLVADLADPAELRWPAYAGAVLKAGVRAVFALPVQVADGHVAALDLYRRKAGALTDDGLAGGLVAAELAAQPILELVAGIVDWDAAGESGDGLGELASLERVEVYQATGMIMGQLGVGPTEALVRLRGYAFAHDMTATEVAWAVVERRLALEPDGPVPGPGGERRSAP